MTKKIVKNLLLVVWISFFLTSCIGIKADLTINKDTSGSLTMTYTVSKIIMDIGSEDQKRENLLPLPINREDFIKTFENIPGITLSDYSRKEDEENIYITAKITFKNFNDLNKIEAFRDQKLSLTHEGNQFILKQKLAEKPDYPPTKEALQMADTVFKNYKLEYIYHFPQKITFHNQGEVLNDGKTLRYTISIPQLLRLKQDIFLIVKW